MPIDARSLLRWYDRHHRPLPWRASRGEKPNPYFVFVSEAMLQQTQVATVIPYFNRFIAAFPNVHDLAMADEQQVLRLWQGLGYYRRARNLLTAARVIVRDFDGRVPDNVEDLQKLPGVGRYTAGAIASIAFDQRAAILDGNVARVLCRLDAIRSDPRDHRVAAELWQRAESILPRRRSGDFNQALMELGAVVCTPRNPRCDVCPLKRDCKSFAAGLQNAIPKPRKPVPTPLVRRWTFCINRKRDDRWLIEQRNASGRWAGLWQFVTIEAAASRTPTARTIQAAFSIEAEHPTHVCSIKHNLTHRRYEFDVYRSVTSEGKRLRNPKPSRWVRLEDLADFPLPRPHLKIAQVLSHNGKRP